VSKKMGVMRHDLRSERQILVRSLGPIMSSIWSKFYDSVSAEIYR
jgi:hypothetical protein